MKSKHWYMGERRTFFVGLKDAFNDVFFPPTHIDDLGLTDEELSERGIYRLRGNEIADWNGGTLPAGGSETVHAGTSVKWGTGAGASSTYDETPHKMIKEKP